ncbi:DUF4124 domain-containing protein [Kangiella marina]|uniref:DUF4124 domain-containing protein n=1 Tax=Kangiella marina TaxID=1079178 RepID=A0ABP8IH34_9GAMM
MMKPLRYILLTITLLGTSTVASSADETVMYKKVDENGKITFTDKPIPGSTPITIKTNTNVVDTPKPILRPRKDSDESSEDDDKPFQYQVLAVDSPQHDQAVRANTGDMNVIVGITPSLQPNHSLQLIMDGSPVGSQQKVPYFSLNNVDRGTHELSVAVINDTNKKTLQTSQPVTFHLLRASILNR